MSVSLKQLTLKVPFTTAAEDNLEYFFHCVSKKIRLDISFEFSARQRIHMKYQALFSSKDKSRKIKESSAAILLGTLWVNTAAENNLKKTSEELMIPFFSCIN